ncbi:MAG: hypothetical protein GY737_08070 [Desulfobacteraceae bacterium]|nr:hypothetical protein [Desulfobacteraceae bacterium]
MVKRSVFFLVWAGGCLLFILLAGLMIDDHGMVRPLIRFIEERDIDAGALYYTEVEEFSYANAVMENTMAYPPMDYCKEND